MRQTCLREGAGWGWGLTVYCMLVPSHCTCCGASWQLAIQPQQRRCATASRFHCSQLHKECNASTHQAAHFIRAIMQPSHASLHRRQQALLLSIKMPACTVTTEDDDDSHHCCRPADTKPCKRVPAPSQQQRAAQDNKTLLCVRCMRAPQGLLTAGTALHCKKVPLR
jgi:hypothetical protein